MSYKTYSKNRKELVPEGSRYLVNAIDADATLTQRGKSQATVELEFLDDDVNGLVMPWQAWFSDAAKSLTVKGFQALGWDGEHDWTKEGREASGLTISDILPNEVFAVVQHEEALDKDRKKTGFWRARVAFINDTKSRAGLGKPMDAEQKAGFMADMVQMYAEATAGTEGSADEKVIDADTGEELKF